MFNSQVRLTGLLLLLAISGCGGGGGGNGGASSPTPGGYSVGGSINGLVGDIWLQINDAEFLNVKSNGGFTFATKFPAGAYYVVKWVQRDPRIYTFTNQVCSVSNSHGTVTTNVLDVSVTCVTPDDSGVTKIADSRASDLQLVSNSSGVTFAAWSEPVDARGRFWVSRNAGNGVWEAPLLLDESKDNFSVGPRIAVDVAGHAIAAWMQWDGSRSDIWASRYSVGSGWGPNSLIENNPADASSLALSMDPMGNSIAIWEQSDGAHSMMWANRYVANGGWQTASVIGSSDGGRPGSSSVAMDASGNAIAVWGEQTHFWANSYSAGGGWSTATVLMDVGVIPPLYAQVVMDGSGNALAVWAQQSIPATTHIMATRYVAGSGWSAASSLDNPALGSVNPSAPLPEIALDANGNAIAVWLQKDGNLDSVCTNRYVADQGWGTATLIETDSQGDASNLKVVANGDGSGFVVWAEPSVNASINLWAVRYSSANGWGPLTLVTSRTNYFSRLSVTPLANGSDLVVWADSLGIWAKTVN
jgi:hypothetical protein